MGNCKKQSCEEKFKTSIGGQALIEGIMMRGPEVSAMAVRNPAGEIVLEKWKTTTSNRAKILKLPIVRGMFNFIDSMKIGYRCLMRSAEIAMPEEEDPNKPKTEAEKVQPAVEAEEPETAEEPEEDDGEPFVEPGEEDK